MISLFKRLIDLIKRVLRIVICGLIDLRLFLLSFKILLYYFFSTFIINKIINFKYGAEKREFIGFCKNKLKFNNRDLFSNNIPSWLYIFNKFLNDKKNVVALEIGPYEGRSSCFLLKSLNNLELTCVDTFEPFQELQGNYPEKFHEVFNNFKNNTKDYSDKLKIIKNTSQEFFSNNKSKFDLIYIDGSHKYEDVLSDGRNALKCLNKKGIIIFDDFLWGKIQKINQTPTFAIMNFLYESKDEIKILYLNYQIIIQKK